MTGPAVALHDTRALKRRRQALRRRRLKIGGLVAGAVAVVGLVVWVVVFSPVFAAGEVRVTGVAQVTADEVVAAAQVPLGTPLVRLDTAAIAERVAELPAVRSAEVTRRPFGTVEIAVTERTAVYALAVEGGATLVDAEGVAYLAVAAVPEGLLPATAPQTTQRMLAGAATAVLALTEGLRAQIVSVTVTSADHIEFTLVTGATLLWGDATDSETKATVATTLIGVPASHYDVSAPAHPATRP